MNHRKNDQSCLDKPSPGQKGQSYGVLQTVKDISIMTEEYNQLW